MDPCQLESPCVSCAAFPLGLFGIHWTHWSFLETVKIQRCWLPSPICAMKYAGSSRVLHTKCNVQLELFRQYINIVYYVLAHCHGTNNIWASLENEYFLSLSLLSFVPRCFSLTYQNSSSPADNSFSICTIHVENIWEIVSPIGDDFELNDVNSDQAAGTFHFGVLKTSSWGYVEKNLLK